MGINSFEQNFFSYFTNLKRLLEASPINLGGVTASGGGADARPGSYIGYLPQTRVAFDLTESGSNVIPVSGASLLDNLNRIRYRLNTLEGQGMTSSGILNDNYFVTYSGGYYYSNTTFQPVDGIYFNTAYGDGHAEGFLHWDSEDNTLEVGMPGGEVKLQIGQENLIRARNDQGSQIDNGQAVYISGASGANPLIKLADKSSIATAGTVGLATEDIADGQFGYVTSFGLVRDIDTSSFSSGDIVWLGDDGNFQTTRPTSPDFQVGIGVVTRSHITEGVVFVNPYITPRLQGLSDVTISGIADNDVIYWNDSNSRFENSSISDLTSDLYVAKTGDTMTGELGITRTITGDAGFEYNLNSTMTVDNTVSRTNATYGVYSKIDMQGAQNNASVQYALRGFVENNNTAAISQGRGVSTRVQNIGNGDITAVYGGRHRIMNDGSGTLGWVYGNRVVIENNGAGDINYAYGFYADDVVGTIENYAIYTNAGDVRLGDKVTIDGSQDVIQLLVQGHSTQTANIFEIETFAAADLFTVSNDGAVAIAGYVGISNGTPAPTSTYMVTIDPTFTSTGDSNQGLRSILTLNPSSTRTGLAKSGLHYIITEGVQDFTGALVGNESGVNIGGTGTVSDVRAVRGIIQNLDTGTVTLARGGLFEVENTGGGTITTAYGVYVGSIDGDTAYGLWVSNIDGVSNSYAIRTGTGLITLGDAVTITGSQDEIQLKILGNATQTSNIFELQTSGSAQRFYVDNDGDTYIRGNVGVGVAPDDNIGLYLLNTWTDLGDLEYGIRVTQTVNSNAGVRTGPYYGNYIQLVLSGSNNITGAMQTTWSEVNVTNTATVSSVRAGTFEVENQSSGVVTNAYGVWAQVRNSGAGSIGTGYALYIPDVTATTPYAIYTAGAGKIRFGDSLHLMGSSGHLSIGTLTQTNYRTINIITSITTAFSAGAGVFMDITANPSGAAHNLYGHYIDVTANTTTYNVSTLHGVYVANLANSGGGTVTTAYGIRVVDINSATTNWAIYTDAGKVSFGDAYGGRELSSDPADPPEGSHYIWQSDGTGTGDDGDILYKETSGGATEQGSLKWKDFVPSAVTVVVGSSSSSLSDAQTMFDGNTYDVDEVASTPGYNVEFTFSGVDRNPTLVVTRWKYGPNSTHDATIDIYNYNTTGWDTLRQHSDTGGYFSSMTMYLPLVNQANYVSVSGVAKIRFYHGDGGSASHDLNVDYVGLTHGLQGVL